jgi:hypothetical protein
MCFPPRWCCDAGPTSTTGKSCKRHSGEAKSHEDKRAFISMRARLIAMVEEIGNSLFRGRLLIVRCAFRELRQLGACATPSPMPIPSCA